mgnify:CR=1 FL=1
MEAILRDENLEHLLPSLARRDVRRARVPGELLVGRRRRRVRRAARATR